MTRTSMKLLALIVLIAGFSFASDKGPIEPSQSPADGFAIDSKGNQVFLTGELGLINTDSIEVGALDFLSGLMNHDRTSSQSLVINSSKTDDLGQSHIRIGQVHNGLPVHGAEMIVHAFNDTGEVFTVNGILANLDNAASQPSASPQSAVMQAVAMSNIRKFNVVGNPQLAYVMDQDGEAFLAWQTTIEYEDKQGPQRDILFADATGQERVVRYPQHHYAKNRRTYDGNNGSSLPGTLVRTEGQGPIGDGPVDAAHDNAGITYDYYNVRFGRDSYNNAGAQLRSTAHHRSNYNNAFWNGSQMVYGDGDGSVFAPLSEGFDVVAHELTHAVTNSESNLIYQNESGALNEAWSDIFAAGAEAYRDGNVNANTWRIGEEVYTPNGSSTDALRYMNNPTADGSSYDYYPTRYTGSADNGGVHWNSGIANLAFYLLVTGGTHPRGVTSVNVTSIGMSKAEQIFYRAQTNYLTASSNFQAARNATASAASDLYGQSEIDAVHEAWDAVGVPGSPGGGGGPAPGSCPSGYEKFTGTLTGTGDVEFEPNGTYYFSSTGDFQATLEGPSGTDYDLRLWKWLGSWQTVASSLSSSSSESITYNGSSGYYAWRINSYSGSGGYTFCLDR